MHLVSNEIFWNSVLFQFCFRHAQHVKKNEMYEMFPETNVHSETQTFAEVSQCFIQQTLMEWHVSELYVTALPQTRWWVGGCAH